jgi:hypothetical protein
VRHHANSFTLLPLPLRQLLINGIIVNWESAKFPHDESPTSLPDLLQKKNARCRVRVPSESLLVVCWRRAGGFPAQKSLCKGFSSR